MDVRLLGLRWAPIVALAMLAAGCTGVSDSQAKDSPAPSASGGCGDSVDQGSLPDWARAGFTPPEQHIPHVVGDAAQIAGVLFGSPLNSPPAKDHSNKILWVSRPDVASGSTLRIHATLEGSGRTADRKVAGGPGPSTIDLPAPGCWTLELRWSGHRDTMRVPYRQG